MKRRDREGIPKPTTDDLESEMERMSGEVSIIERWLIDRADRKFAVFQERDERTKAAYRGGYKTGYEEASILWMLAFIVFLAAGYFVGWF